MAARYTVKFVAGERRGSLLVLLSPTQPCSALVDAVRIRLVRANSTVSHPDLSEAEAALHLEDPDGPELYAADTLSDVLPGAKETVVVVFQTAKSTSPSAIEQETPPSIVPSLKIRVISPELARSTDINAIATLSRAISLNCTLKELRARVQEHLGFPPNDGACQELECSCNFVRQIDEHAVLRSHGTSEHGALNTVVIIYGNNEVTVAHIAEPTLAAVHKVAAEHSSQPNKVVDIIGGVINGSGERERYIKLPVLSICSSARHSKPRRSFGKAAAREERDLVVDIHTSECPIEFTAHNADVSLADVGLADCAIGGVLNLFALQRWNIDQEEVGQGKAGIFKRCAAWENPHGQSDRGLSNLLSTLRMFAHLTTGGNMEDKRQDAVLHMIYMLTKFPPAVPAACILMRGETLYMPERAALAQCLYQVLKGVVPERIIRSDTKPYFEGSRLLAGLILEKAKNLKISQVKDDTDLPYINMKVHDLRNLITMDSVLSVPVQTKSGLLDAGFYRAFQQGGLLAWTNTIDLSILFSSDDTWRRVVILSGGIRKQLVAFNVDTVQSSSRYKESRDVDQLISAAEYSDMTYLAGLCSRNQLNVLPPSALPSASVPALTLDRECSLAVYIGRAPCGEPGRDILLFRPNSTTEEEGIDVSIITQVLQPILNMRKADGTAIFEACGDQQRQLVAPDEITMLCVDLSRSMIDRCGFIDIENSEDSDGQLHRHKRRADTDSSDATREHPGFPLPDVDDLKEYLKAHESYNDFLAIIRTGRDDYERRSTAEKVLQILQQVNGQQIEMKTKELERLRQQTTYHVSRTRAESIEREVYTTRNRCLRLQSTKSLLCAWFVTSVTRSDSRPDPLTWKPGDAIPTIAEPLTDVSSYAGPHFELPRDYCCHIRSEIMADPVTTMDGFTYERRNIERWFQANERSPMTNLILASLDLRLDHQKKEEIEAFVNGRDIISHYKSLRGDPGFVRVSIKSPLNNWSLQLPRSLKLSELWEIAFRLATGRHGRFDLHHQNMVLPSSQNTITSAINVNHTVFIVPLPPTTSPAQDGPQEELCLVKIYDESYDLVTSYWEPKNTVQTLASVIFRYYRARFSGRPRSSVAQPFMLWCKLQEIGDGHHSGKLLEDNHEPLSKLFSRYYCTGILSEDQCVDRRSDDEEQDARNTLLVLKLALDSKKPRTNRTTTLSRLDVLKQIFDAFINRVLAYGFQTHLGLVTFGSRASISQEITNTIENFRHKLNHMEVGGDTALWDSIALAQDQLGHYAARYPKAKLRIIYISDGEDNTSNQVVVNIVSRLQRDRIVLDSFCLGNARNDDLKTVSYLAGGYVFEPKTLEEAMAICELEPVLSTLERPEEHQPGAREFGAREQFRMTPTQGHFLRAARDVKVQRVTHDVFPRRKEHAQLSETFVELRGFATPSYQGRSDGHLRTSRIPIEIRNSGAFQHPHYDVYICESNMALWKVVMQGPPQSTYAGGTFVLFIEMGDGYPILAPTARFVTPIYHPNINRHGRICHSIFDRNWIVDTTNKDMIDTIYSLLLVPEFSDPINTVVTLNYHWDEVQFKEEAQRHVQKHASKSRSEWRREILG